MRGRELGQSPAELINNRKIVRINNKIKMF